MQTKFVVAAFSLALLSLAGRCQHVIADAQIPVAGTWIVGPRALPAPAGASEALRSSIAGSPQPDVARHIEDAPKSEEQWLAAITAADAGGAEGARSLAESMSVTVTADTIVGVNVYRLVPEAIDPANKDRLFVHLHGGGYVFGSGMAGISEAVVIAQFARIEVLSIDYRMPPEHPFPAAVNDVIAVWRNLLESCSASSMALGGTSAGGGLALAATLELKRLEINLPGALWVGTPWADLTKTGDSQFTNEGIDRILVSYDGLLEGAAKLYADGRDLKTPLISPVYGDFDAFPPTYLVTGTRDLFLSDTVRVHRKLRNAGIIADLNVYEGISHAEYGILFNTPEGQQAYRELAAFLQLHLQ